MSKVQTVLNSENITIEKARELVGNAVLWPRVRDFLWDFAPQIHESWLETLKVEGLQVEGSSAQSSNFQLSDLQPSTVHSTRVKRFILDTLGVEPCFHDFPKEDGSRLLLLDGATLLEIAKWLGALACAPELRRVTDGATVRALKAALPGVYPEVFGYTAYFGGFSSICASRRDAEPQRMDERVLRTGYEILVSALGDLPASLVSRLAFTLPKKLCVSAPLRETMSRRDEMKDTAARSGILKLLKLKFPEAHSLCCC